MLLLEKVFYFVLETPSFEAPKYDSKPALTLSYIDKKPPQMR